MQIIENRYKRWFKQLLTPDAKQQNIALFEFLDQPALLIGLIATQNLGKGSAKHPKMTITPEQQAFVQWVIANVSLADALAITGRYSSATLKHSEGQNFLTTELPKDPTHSQWKAAAKAVGNFWADQVIDYWFDRIQESDRKQQAFLAHRFADRKLRKDEFESILRKFEQEMKKKYPDPNKRTAVLVLVGQLDPLDQADAIIETAFPLLQKTNTRAYDIKALKSWSAANISALSTSASGGEGEQNEAATSQRGIKLFKTVLWETQDIAPHVLYRMGLGRVRA